jgi:hypothetical protein
MAPHHSGENSSTISTIRWFEKMVFAALGHLDSGYAIKTAKYMDNKD